MREIPAAGATLAFALLAVTAAAQSTRADLSGRWVLVSSGPVNRDGFDTLEIAPADELLVTQTPSMITIEHPSKRGTHPAVGTFKFGVGGTIGGVPGGASSETKYEVSFFGTQLTISDSTITPDASGGRITSARGSTWQLDLDGRLTIAFRETRSNERPRTATLVYVRKR